MGRGSGVSPVEPVETHADSVARVKSEHSRYDVVIVGGEATGLTSAAYLARPASRSWSSNDWGVATDVDNVFLGGAGARLWRRGLGDRRDHNAAQAVLGIRLAARAATSPFVSRSREHPPQR